MQTVIRFLAKIDSHNHKVISRAIAPIHGIGTALSYHGKCNKISDILIKKGYHAFTHISSSPGV